MGLSGTLGDKLIATDVVTTDQQKADAIATVRRMCPTDADTILRMLGLVVDDA